MARLDKTAACSILLLPRQPTATNHPHPPAVRPTHLFKGLVGLTLQVVHQRLQRRLVWGGVGCVVGCRGVGVLGG